MRIITLTLALIIYSSILLAEAPSAEECAMMPGYFNQLDRIIKEREKKGLEVTTWYTKRNDILLKNSSCSELKKIQAISSSKSVTPVTGLASGLNANSCKPIDLRSKLGPVRNQGNSGWCFAYTAADLLTVKTGNKISAVGVAINFKTDSILSLFDKLKGNSAFRTGQVDSAILSSKNQLCLESELSSDLANIDLEKTFGNIQKKQITSQDCFSLNTILSNNNVNNFIKVISKMSDRDSLKELAKISCKTKLTHNYKAEPIKMNKLINELNDVLQENQIVAVNIDPRFWENGPNYTGKSFDHVASIVGRKWDDTNKTCKFLVRDSSGTNCKIYDGSYGCEGGYTWVPEKTLINNTESAYYLK